MIPVALRSEDPELIETVRSVLAVSSIPLAVLPQSTTTPISAGLALDDVEHPGDWARGSRRYARVGLRSTHDPAPGVLVLPGAAEELLALARIANRVMRARVVGVVGAAGGVGASVFAATLARASTESGLMSALVEGEGAPSLAALLDALHTPGLRWADLPASGVDPDHLTSSLPRWNGVRLLVGDERPQPAPARREAPLAALAHTHDVVVLDLQRSDVAAGLTKRWCDCVLILTTPSVPAVSAARALAATLTTETTHLVVRGPTRAGLTPAEVETMVGVDILTHMRTERSLPGALDRGLAPGDHRRGPLLRAARTTLEALGVIDR